MKRFAMLVGALWAVTFGIALAGCDSKTPREEAIAAVQASLTSTSAQFAYVGKTKHYPGVGIIQVLAWMDVTNAIPAEWQGFHRGAALTQVCPGLTDKTAYVGYSTITISGLVHHIPYVSVEGAYGQASNMFIGPGERLSMKIIPIWVAGNVLDFLFLLDRYVGNQQMASDSITIHSSLPAATCVGYKGGLFVEKVSGQPVPNFLWTDGSVDFVEWNNGVWAYTNPFTYSAEARIVNMVGAGGGVIVESTPYLPSNGTKFLWNSPGF